MPDLRSGNYCTECGNLGFGFGTGCGYSILANNPTSWLQVMIDLVDVSIVFSLQYLLDGFDDFDGINNKVTKMYEKYTLDVAISEARLLLTIFCQTWLEVDSLVSH